MLKTQEELDEELCNYCTVSEELRHAIPIGCESRRCEEAYRRYYKEWEGEE